MNLPNKITLSRIFMIPVFVAVFFLDGVLPDIKGMPIAYAIAAAIFAIAACTDFIDGHIARSRGLVTNLGKFLDPIADKVLVSTAMILLLAMKDILLRGWSYGEELYIALAVCICVIMARELIISAFRQIAATTGLVLAADKLGKYKTTFQDVSIVVLLVSASVFGKVGEVLCIIGLVLFAIATVLTVWSGISYVVKNKQVLKDQK
ncbi:MAG: CDP-diacylglycerol--glycerol-3-phosphate 3-phosphatidyltransferase [Clostridiales bacterium]|nr:CDP-diacylglycerol--glycerol-3-phosphate 3-phosphatidyltransferase [Clostridiales bacterium]